MTKDLKTPELTGGLLVDRNVLEHAQDRLVALNRYLAALHPPEEEVATKGKGKQLRMEKAETINPRETQL
jgi:hypothetical protein